MTWAVERRVSDALERSGLAEEPVLAPAGALKSGLRGRYSRGLDGVDCPCDYLTALEGPVPLYLLADGRSLKERLDVADRLLVGTDWNQPVVTSAQ